jgi:DNA-directed RNA polymerase I, II, and III subunit RPABC2
MSLEELKNINDEESDAGTSDAGTSDAGTGTSDASSDIANPSDFDISEDEEEVEKNPEEEYAGELNQIDASVSHPASFAPTSFAPTSFAPTSFAPAVASKKGKKKIEEEEDEEEEEEEENEEDEEEDEEDYLQKFDKNFRNEFVNQYHPESNTHNYEEVKLRTLITRSGGDTIVDNAHKTLPFLTKYEKTRVLGQRAKQINAGAKPMIDNIPANVMDGYVIAKLELEQKKIPFIIKRPLPSGECEYWNLADLEMVD